MTATIKNEEEIFQGMLQSMGVESFDPLVLSAINEYAKRYASDILCDAKDYSVHRNATTQDIEAEDVDIALKLSVILDSSGPDDATRSFVNNSELLPQDDNIFIRYPRRIVDRLGQRSYTYVPGSEAYPMKEAVWEKAAEGKNTNENNTVSSSEHFSMRFKADSTGTGRGVKRSAAAVFGDHT